MISKGLFFSIYWKLHGTIGFCQDLLTDLPPVLFPAPAQWLIPTDWLTSPMATKLFWRKAIIISTTSTTSSAALVSSLSRSHQRHETKSASMPVCTFLTSPILFFSAFSCIIIFTSVHRLFTVSLCLLPQHVSPVDWPLFHFAPQWLCLSWRWSTTGTSLW